MLKTISSIVNAIGALNYKGTWNASTNTPALASGVGVKGDYYVVSVAGTTALDGISNWGVGDWVTYNGSAWQRVEGGADLNGVNLSVSGVATFAAGSAAAPSITTAGDTNTGIFFPAADSIGFSEGGVEAMRIDTSGNLRLGTATATGGKQMIAFDNAGQSGTRYIHSSSTYNAAALTFLQADNSTAMGFIYCDGAATTYATSSDYRLKENVQPMTGALARVAALKPCTYKWKGMEKTSEGFIAHELQEICPSAVSGEKDAVNEDGSIKPQGVDTSFLVATLTAAIQEQQVIIESLKARLDAANL
jgi:hypothetical protein